MEYHIERFESAYFSYFEQMAVYDFAANISIPKEYQEGICKLMIRYNQVEQKFIIEHYQPRKITSLKLVVDNAINYELKYSNRSRIEHLYQMRKDCDDILIVKNGLVTDTSFSNIAFFDGSQWVTPIQPLLKGTMRQRLLNDSVIFEENIKVEDLDAYVSCKLINAMKDFNTEKEIKIENIKK
ncbi:MAG: aminotransferase class IV [Cyclobacteriaceae bacterium]|nr:aminotransferase class IV [Cyclobacteriaceae bacterium]